MISIHALRVKKSALSERHRVWIFSNEVEHLAKNAVADKTIVLVQLEGASRFGLYDRNHLISVRLFDEVFSEEIVAHIENKTIAEQNFQNTIANHIKRIQRLKLALGFNDGKNAYRLVHGDADGLPSVIIDDYQSVLVLQSGSRAGDWLHPHVCEALKQADARPLYERSTGQSRQMDGLPERNQWLRSGAHADSEHCAHASAALTATNVFHADMPMSFDLQRAQKTGLFLDQRANLNWLGQFLLSQSKNNNGNSFKNNSVLDICSYAGAWSAKAAQSGFKTCVLIDQDKQALAMATTNIHQQKNASDVAVEALQGDMFEHLAALANQNRAFDVVVADPPAFAKSAKHVPEARRAYARLVKQSSRLVAPKGLYVICSCSRNMEEDEFFDLVCKNLDARQRWLLVFKGSQSADHTMLANDKHSRYLKCFAFVNASATKADKL